MATVNFSVPEDVKESFNATFSRQNKSAVIAHHPAAHCYQTAVGG